MTTVTILATCEEDQWLHVKVTLTQESISGRGVAAGQCTGGSSSKIKVKPDDGRLEVEFEVDQNRSGQPWKVKIKDNSAVVFKGSARTHAPSGSFSVERRIDNRSGSDHLKATARNKKSGERCAANVTI